VIVADTSVLLPALGDDGRYGETARQRLFDEQLAAPELLDLELLSAFRGLVRSGRMSALRATTALTDFSDLVITRAAHGPLLPRCWELRENLTPYDAAYVGLAEHLGVPLVTADNRLVRTPGIRCDVEVLR
jgi:predicted nucleic acid-binding protein